MHKPADFVYISQLTDQHFSCFILMTSCIKSKSKWTDFVVIESLFAR